MAKTLVAALALSLAAFSPAWAQDTAAPATDAATTAEIQDFSIGNPDATVKITEYASFTCPHCAHFHDEVWPKLKADYIDTGKVQFTYREVYFDRYGLWAAMVARCGGEMRYFGFVDELFSKQGEWAASDDPNVVVGNLKTMGKAAGLDEAAIDQCLNDGPQAEALVAHFQKNFDADGVEGTPSFLINGTLHKNMSYDEFKAILDEELAK